VLLDPLEDVLNFLLTIGSPCLAAYSLQITHLNTGWLTKAFLDLKFPNSKSISTVVAAFQHAPIQISLDPALLSSLIVLQKNDGYWESLLKGVKKTRRWSIPLVMNFVWVVVATLLTVIDSFYSPPAGDVGYAIVAIWTYLLPLIMGWLHVGSQPEPNHLRECLEVANRSAWVATDDKNSPALAEDVAGHSTQAIEFSSGEVDLAWRDELRTVPVFNYSRVFIWSLNAQRVLSFVKNASGKAKKRMPVDDDGPGQPTGASGVSGGPGTVASENRLGTEDQVVRYCTEVTMPFEKMYGMASPVYPPSPVAVHFPSAPTGILPSFNSPTVRKSSRWAPGVWGRVFVAVLFALGAAVGHGRGGGCYSLLEGPGWLGVAARCRSSCTGWRQPSPSPSAWRPASWPTCLDHNITRRMGPPGLRNTCMAGRYSVDMRARLWLLPQGLEFW
jgi:hypothetical protein